MARNDGVDRTVARNRDLKTHTTLQNAQAHNERQKEVYSNPDIVDSRTSMNVHYKKPTGSYEEMFSDLESKKIISTWGLKPDSTKFCELVFDVNSAYFFNHGGYEFAKRFYTDVYKAAAQIVGGEQYILSAVMHADERNRAMSEALGRDVFHYHLHVIYVPVVEKQILWSKRCKDKALVGTVKETVMQVSRTKKWASKPALDADGNPLLTKKGKPVLKPSYSVLQDDFYNAMIAAGYTDLQRGERGSTEEHLTVTQFKVEQEQHRLEAITEKLQSAEADLELADAAVDDQRKKLDALKQETKAAKTVALTVQDIREMGKSTVTGKIAFSPEDANALKQYAINGIVAKAENAKLNEQLASAKKDASIWRARYEKLKETVKPFLDALALAPERVRKFIESVLTHCRLEQEKRRQRNEQRRDVSR